MNSNQGLLGLGRAYSALNEHKKSLVPWLKLVERNPSDPAVQDALMAVPYAFGQLEAYKQSLDYYEKAMRLFQEEINKINTAAEAVSGGKLVEGLIRAQTGESVSGLWTEAKVLNTPEGQYLWPLLTQYEFRETMFNYSQLRLSLGKLEGWSASLDTFDSLNDKRRAVYESRITQLQTQVLLASEKLNHHLQRMAFDELDKRKQRLVQYFNEARFSVAQIYDYAAKRWGEPQQ
jgi:tetratricopeptide (TPR) repeat protein